MRLFEVGKVGLFLDTITHATEAREGDTVKIVTLVLRVQPFDAQLAASMVDGVKPTLFTLNSGEPKEALRRVDFTLGVPRQNLIVFAAPDTSEPSIALSQVKISGTYARTEKGVRGYGFVFKASFGPLGRAELEYIQDWHLTQRFVTFEEAEPGLFEEAEDVVDEEAPVEDGPHAAPMFDDAGNETPAALAANRPLHSHQSRRGRKPAAAAAAAAE